MAETKKDPKIKEIILASALKLMSEKGVSGTSLSDIAIKCEISKGTLYYYYRSKDALIFDINKWNMEKLTSDLLDLLDSFIREGKEVSEILLEMFKTISGAQTRGRMHLYLINEGLSRNPDLVKKLRDSYGHWFNMLEEAFAKILPAKTDREAAARALVASLDGIMIQNILSIDEIPLERVVTTLVSGYGV
jgi:AcrR family transcriptional regulator